MDGLGDFFSKMDLKLRMPTKDEVLVGRSTPLSVEPKHFVNGQSILASFPEGSQTVYFGMGCFWGAERKFWTLPDVHVTAVGYGAGFTQNPTYEEVCSGKTGHNELVMVVYRGGESTFKKLLKVFWESHDPTQGFRQGNDRGTQYRSGIYTTNSEQIDIANHSKEHFQKRLIEKNTSAITTEIFTLEDFYYAETYHQQYLAKNPNGYCGLGGCGILYD